MTRAPVRGAFPPIRLRRAGHALLNRRGPPSPDPGVPMAVFGVDYSWGRPGVAALKRAGVKFVCRYLSHDTTGKNLTRAEAEELSDAGLWIVVVWQTTKNRPLDGRAAGVADARDAAAQARA